MLACFVVVVCLPNARALKHVSDELATAEQLLATKMNEVKELPGVAENVARIKQERDGQLLKVPCEPRLPEFLGTVADILRSEKIVERELVPQRPKAVQKDVEWTRKAEDGTSRKEKLAVSYTELPINITFRAPFRSAFRVLSRLQDLPRVSHVEQVKLSTVPRAPDRVQVDMQVVIYHHNEQVDKPATAGDAKASKT